MLTHLRYPIRAQFPNACWSKRDFFHTLDQPFTLHVDQLRVDGVLQVPFDLHQRFLHNIATGRTRHKSPLGPLVNILMMALTDSNVSRSPEPIPDALESVAFLFERATSTEIKIDLQKANLHLLGSCPEIALS